MKLGTRSLVFLVLPASLAIGFGVGRYSPQIETLLSSAVNRWDSTNASDWPRGFSVVTISSSADRVGQAAYFSSAPPGPTKPLVVSLHTWSGDYSQNDPLAQMSMDAGWNYIHPDFRGPNSTVDACLSGKAMVDIDDAIQFAIEKGNVDVANVFVVGVSGGGYATLGMYLKTRHRVRSFLAWAPISDISAWYHQSLNRDPKYAQDILKCTSSGAALDETEARLRSPLHWDIPQKPNGGLEIFTGINDGYQGSVPISHSILFYNRIVQHFGNRDVLVDQDDVVDLLTRATGKNGDLGRLGDREVHFKRGSDSLSLTIFEGGHEMLTEYCFGRMKQMAEQTATHPQQ